MFVGGDRCYDVATLNDGQAAFDACMCSSESQTFSSCSVECRDQLEQLTEDVGCCAHAAIYTFFFSSCGNANIDPPLETIDTLFKSCNVTLPPTCLHTFSALDTGDNGSVTVTSNVVVLFFILMFIMLIN